MNRYLILTTLVGLLVLSTPCTGAAQSGTFKLKRRSSYTAQDSDRNPFWPVGWVKPVIAPAIPNAPAPVEVIELHPDDYKLTSILLGTPPIVVINGKEYAEGDFLKNKGGGPKVQLAQVMDGKVILRFMGKSYPVPLHRKGDEVGVKKATPLLKLNQE